MGVPYRNATGLEIGRRQQHGVVLAPHDRLMSIVKGADLAEQMAPKRGIAPAYYGQVQTRRIAILKCGSPYLPIEPGRVAGVEAAGIREHKRAGAGVTEGFCQLLHVEAKQNRHVVNGLRAGGVVVHHQYATTWATRRPYLYASVGHNARRGERGPVGAPVSPWPGRRRR